MPFNYLPGVEFVLVRQDDLYIAGTKFAKLDITVPRIERGFREQPHWFREPPPTIASSMDFTMMAVSNDFEACMTAAKKWLDCQGQEGTYYVWIPREGEVEPVPIINQEKRNVPGPRRLAPPQV